MKIAVTGATGFVGRYLVEHLAGSGHSLRCWYRESSDREGFRASAERLKWVAGELSDPSAIGTLIEGCDAVVHSALYRPGSGFIGSEGELIKFVEWNLIGSLRLIEESKRAGVGRFVFISTCAVHDVILEDRPLDETHPLWPKSHYGAHKAAIEAFVSSFGRGEGYAVCALRPTGIYGLARPAAHSKWFSLVDAVARGENVTCRRGGKEVHASDVAKAVGLLLEAGADQVAGQAFNCYDRYVSEYEVAILAKEMASSGSRIEGEATHPKNQISVEKLKGLGMEFGGRALLERAIREILEARAT